MIELEVAHSFLGSLRKLPLLLPIAALMLLGCETEQNPTDNTPPTIHLFVTQPERRGAVHASEGSTLRETPLQCGDFGQSIRRDWRDYENNYHLLIPAEVISSYEMLVAAADPSGIHEISVTIEGSRYLNILAINPSDARVDTREADPEFVIDGFSTDIYKTWEFERPLRTLRELKFSLGTRDQLENNFLRSGRPLRFQISACDSGSADCPVEDFLLGTVEQLCRS